MQLTQDQFIDQVREALARLYDPAALRAHPLARLVPFGGEASGSDGTALRQRLMAGIEGLKPGPEVDPAARVWRSYQLLRWRYIERLDPAEVQRRLAISKSQYYREHEAALASLVSLLRDERWLYPATAGAVPDGLSGSRPWKRIGVAGLAACGL